MIALIKSFLLVFLGFALGALSTLMLLRYQEGSGILPTGPRPAVAAKTAPAAPASNTTLFGKPATASTPAPAPVSPEPAPSPQSSGSPESSSSAEPPPPPAPRTPEPESPDPAPADPAPRSSLPEPPVDFGELCIKPAAWPPVITLNKAIDAQILQGNEIIGEIPVAAGERLQVTKVFGDGTVEVRAKGARFIVDHKITDLEPQARARLAEISGKPRAPVLAPPAPRAEPTPRTPRKDEPAPAQEPSTGDDDLDRRMRTLFGTPSRR